MPKLILLRHGQSVWNLENKFTGWVDVDLSEKGIKEAHQAGKALKGEKIDIIFSSVLKRANRTADIALKEMGLDMPYERDQALNERHYGDLQGLNKADTAKKYGDEQVHIWRRSYDINPPGGESLKDTKARVLPYFEEKILPELKQGKNVFIVAHGNSLRSLVMHLENISQEEILKLNIPTGVPYVYEMDDKLNILSKNYLEIEE